MNRAHAIDALNELAADAIALANALEDGLDIRIRDSMPGHVKSPNLDPSSNPPPPQEDLPDELRGRPPHSDPTGSAAVQAMLVGNRGKDDSRSFFAGVAKAREALRSSMDVAARYNARPASLMDRQVSSVTNAPGCVSCARVASPGSVGKSKAEQVAWWNPVHRETKVDGEKVGLCSWCLRSEVGAYSTGSMPTREQVEANRDGKPVRKSA